MSDVATIPSARPESPDALDCSASAESPVPPAGSAYPACSSSPAPRERVAWVDVARCLGMFFIMWLHAGGAPHWVGRPVGGGICLFFVLAGYFMPREPWPCLRRALLLALAWLLWSLITLGLYLLVWPEMEWSWAHAFGWGQSAYNAPLWFLKDLAVFQLIISALLALRLLPRWEGLFLLLLAGFSYASEPAQHQALRFDWMMAVVLGFCLRRFSLQDIRQALCRHAGVLLIAIFLLLAQRECFPLWARAASLEYTRCSLPLAQLAYATLFCLASLAMERFLPRWTRWLALAGGSMMFTYVAHSLLYAPLYYFRIRVGCNLWVPLLALPLLTGMFLMLKHWFPRAMRLLCAR